MKIVIAGAGEMGSHLAKMLSGNGHDITVIDSDPKLLADVASLADVLTVEGDSTTFAVLRKASVRKCDLFIAVNHVENDNVVAAVLAKQLGAKKSIARIDNNEYLEPNNKEIFINMGIDYLFYPEKVAAQEVINLLGHTSTTEYVDFSSGRLSLVVFRLDPTSSLIGRELSGFKDDAAQLSYRTVAIARGGQTIIARQDEIFMEGDMVYVIARQDAVKEVMEFSGHSNVEINNMMILGGSRIGIRIATELQDEVNIKLIDYNAEKAYRLAELLDKTLIINEDGRHIEAMLEEGLANMDAFIAVTGRSETNILAAMLAKRMGVNRRDREPRLYQSGREYRYRYDHQQETGYGVEHLPLHDVNRRAGDQVSDGQRGRGAGVHRQAQRPGDEGSDQGVEAAAGYDYRRRGARRQGFHRRGKHGVERLRSRGGFRYAGVDLQNWIFL